MELSPLSAVPSTFVKSWIKGKQKFSLYCINHGLELAYKAANCFEKAVGKSEVEYRHAAAEGIELWKRAGVVFKQAKQESIEFAVYYQIWVLHHPNFHGLDFGRNAMYKEWGPYSSTEIKRRAILAVIQDKRPFVLSVKDQVTKQQKQVMLASLMGSVEESITWYKSRDLFIENGKPGFCKTIFVRDWFIENKKITLYCLEDGFLALRKAIELYKKASRAENRSDFEAKEREAKVKWREAIDVFNAAQHKEFEGQIYEKIWLMKNKPVYLDYGKHAFNREYGFSTTPEEKEEAINKVLYATFGSDQRSFEVHVDDYTTGIRKSVLCGPPPGSDRVEEIIVYFQTEDIWNTCLKNLLINPFAKPANREQNRSVSQDPLVVQWIRGNKKITLSSIAEGFSSLNSAARVFNHQFPPLANQLWEQGINVFNKAGHSEVEECVYKKIWKIHNKPPIADYGRKAFNGWDGYSAKFEEKSWVITQVLKKLFKRQEPYELILEDFQLKTIERKLFDIPESDKNRKLPYYCMNPGLWNHSFLSCFVDFMCDNEVVFDQNASLQFIKRETYYHLNVFGEKTAFGEKSIELLKPNDLNPNREWRICNHTTKTITWLPAFLNEDTKDFIENHPYDKEYLKDFNIEITEKGIINQTAGLCKKIFESQLDRTVKVDMDSWAVTLASIGTSTGIACGPDGGHAVIYYQGVEKGVRFLKYCHFTEKYGFVSSKTLLNYDEHHIHAKTKTWSVSKNAVLKMIQTAKSVTLVFDFINNNCLFYAVEQIKSLGIHLPDFPKAAVGIRQIQNACGYGEDRRLPKQYINSLPAEYLPRK